MIEEVAKFGFTCHWIKFDHKKRKRGWLSSTLKLFLLLRKLKPDCIHSNLFDDALPTVIAGKLAGVKRRIVVKADTGFHWHYAPKAVFLDKLINRLATDLVAISEESKDFIIHKEKAKLEKICMIHHGIPIQQRLNKINQANVEDFRNEFNLNDKLVIGVVARLILWKGHKYIVDAASEFIKENPSAVFLFIGLGDQTEAIKEQIKNLNLEKHIILTGWVHPDKLPSLFSTFDIFLHAASMEPFGFVIIEAMAHSLALLTTATGAAKDAIIHLENGYLMDEQSSTKINEGLNWILKNNTDKKLNRAAFKTAQEKFDFLIMYNNYVKLYSK